MPKKRYNTSYIRHVLMLVGIPILLTGSGYALFSQQLTIQGTATNPSYSSSQNLILTYDKVITPLGVNDWRYDLTVTIKNNGSSDVNTWHSAFDIPSDASQFSCTDANCTNTIGAVAADNTPSNGVIAANNSQVYTVSFRASVPDYTLQNVSVSGSFPPTYQTISGLSASFTRGSQTTADGIFYWPYTYTVTNNSGNAVSAWRISLPWSATTNAISNVSGTVNYYVTPTQLSFFSTTSIPDGGSFQFTVTLGATSSGWDISGDTIEGAP